jgi:hypothetical protein
MAGGFKQFGPTYNTTPYVRLGYEGILNGTHSIDPSVTNELAGKFATIGANGVTLATDSNKAVGLFREDLADMTNASLKATFYFRGGEYYVALGRTGLGGTSQAVLDTGRTASTFDNPSTTSVEAATIAVGDEITCNANGQIIKLTAALKTAGSKALGIVTYVGDYPAGNMFENAGTVANGGDYVGFIMYI